MKIINANAVLVPHDIPAYQFIEKVGRTAYKSEDKITETSAAGFVRNMVKSDHWAVLEHEYLYLYIGYDTPDFLKNEKYINVVQGYASGSFRAFAELSHRKENEHENDFYPAINELYLMMKEQWDVFHAEHREGAYHDDFGNGFRILSREEFINKVTHDLGAEALMDLLPHTILFTCDRGVTHELVRHRPCAFLQESTRYCNYSKGKFGKEITVIEPCFYTPGTPEYKLWEEGCKHDEETYFALLDLGVSPQQARDNLPTSVKADIYVTATEREWQHIIDLRYHGTTGKPHPQMLEIMEKAYPQLVEASAHRIH